MAPSFEGYKPQEQQSAAQRAFAAEHAEQAEPAPAAAAKPKTAAEAWDFAKKQAEERRALSKKHADTRRSARKSDEAAAAAAAREVTEVKERTELAEKQAKDRIEFDQGRSNLPVFNGLATQDAVAALHADLTALAAEHNIEVGDIHTFGLEFDVFDPVTGQLTSPAQAHRRDIGQAGILLTAEAAISDIESARRHQAAAGVTQYSVDRVM